nr:hypothetical protein [uncultured Rhodopila sp.]
MKTSKAQRGRSAVVFTSAAVISAACMAALLSALGPPTPQVGDIVVFAPAASRGEDNNLRIAVHRPGQPGCVLDLDTIRQTGGSLVVEARLWRPIPGFRLHWAGERTATESDDCGANADLLVSKSDLGSLAIAAGGYGIDPQRPSMIASAMAD